MEGVPDADNHIKFKNWAYLIMLPQGSVYSEVV